VKLEQARAFALSLPETVEQPHFDMSSFRVNKKIFCTVPAEGKTLHVFVGDDEARAAVAEDPAAFEELWWGKKLSGVRVHLAKAKVGPVRELLEESWRMRAPKKVLSEYEARR
jgi:hypothetical protein